LSEKDPAPRDLLELDRQLQKRIKDREAEINEKFQMLQERITKIPLEILNFFGLSGQSNGKLTKPIRDTYILYQVHCRNVDVALLLLAVIR
jgi:hypothetical protein